MAVRKKSGAPDPKYFESSDTVSKFEPVRQLLVKNCRKVGNNLNDLVLTRNTLYVYLIIILINAHLHVYTHSTLRLILPATRHCLPSHAPCYNFRRLG